MSARNILAALSLGRVIIGVLMVVAPRLVGERWLGEGANSGEAQAFLQTTGVRDAAYAIGCLQAVRSGANPKPWLAAGVAIDGTDAVATLTAAGVPAKVRLVGSIAAIGATIGNIAGLVADDS